MIIANNLTMDRLFNSKSEELQKKSCLSLNIIKDHFTPLQIESSETDN